MKLTNFEWEEEGFTVETLIKLLKSYNDDAKILIEDSDGSTSDLLTVNNIQYWMRDEQIDGVPTGRNEYVVMFSKYK